MPEGEICAPQPIRGLDELETLVSQRPGLAPLLEDFAGAVVGERYRVHGQLGKGGTAAVYLAEDQTLGRQVALKILSPDLARSERWAHRFRREARAVARLEHPNIVKIYDYGETATGLLYFVMEYVRGYSLAQILTERAEEGKGGLPLLHVRHIALQICRAIRAAHDERIVHRDLKPGNIMIVPQADGVGLVKVLDFGIAKLAEDGSDSRDTPSRLTGIGLTIGTPEYMAPEQVLGELLDHRSDVYALGCILYELLTGDVPFSAEPRERVRYKHVFEAPLPPSERRPEVPPALEAVCLRALEKSPERRFQSMAEMELALERELEGDLDPLQVSAPPAPAADGAGLAAPLPPDRRRRDQPSPTPRPTVLEHSLPVSARPVEEARPDAKATPLPSPTPPAVSSWPTEEAWPDAKATPLPSPAPPPVSSWPTEEAWLDAKATPLPSPTPPPPDSQPSAETPSIVAGAAGLASQAQDATEEPEAAADASRPPEAPPLLAGVPVLRDVADGPLAFEAPLDLDLPAGSGGPVTPEISAPVIAMAPSELSQPRRLTSIDELPIEDPDEPTPVLRPRRRVLLWFALGGATALVVAGLLALQDRPVPEAQGRAERPPLQLGPGAALSSEATPPIPQAARPATPTRPAPQDAPVARERAAARKTPAGLAHKPTEAVAAERRPAPAPPTAKLDREGAAAERKPTPKLGLESAAAERKPAPKLILESAAAEREPAPAAASPRLPAPAERKPAPRPAAPNPPELELPLPSDVPLSAPSS